MDEKKRLRSGTRGTAACTARDLGGGAAAESSGEQASEPDSIGFERGVKDIAALRRYVRLSPEEFAKTTGIGVHTPRNSQR